jgi:hypothetical protein
LIVFLPRSGFGVYSMDRHVSIEKYNMLWFKGIAGLRLCPKSWRFETFGNGLSQLIGQTGFLPKKSFGKRKRVGNKAYPILLRGGIRTPDLKLSKQALYPV